MLYFEAETAARQAFRSTLNLFGGIAVHA